MTLRLAWRALAAIGALSSASAAAPAPARASDGFFDDFGAIDGRRWYISDGWTNGSYQNCTWTRNNVQVRRGVLQIRLTQEKNSLRAYRCGEIRTQAALGYGVYEARIRTAAGSGLNSAMFTYSGPPLTKVHDEIDFEFLGRDPSRVQLNYYVNGQGRHEQSPSLGIDASRTFNNYAFEWRPGSLRWFVNGRVVRGLRGQNLPRTPGQFFFSLWGGTAEVGDWLGRFQPSSAPALAEVDWAAYTPLDRKCLFPQSITCG